MAEITKSLKETAGKITGGLGRGLSKLSSVFKSNKIEPAMSETSGSMSNTQYLGSIYQLMVDSDEERRLEYQRELNLKEESDSEEQRQHQEIIKALTLRRVPKRKKGISKEQKQSEKVEKTAKSTVGKKTKKPKVPKKGEPAKKDEPAKKPTDAEKDKRKEQKSSAKDEQIKKDKKSADDAKAAADKKTADAKTSAQKKEADRAQEAAKKKADDAKAAEEAKKASDARRAADDASKKRIAEDRAKKEAETKAKKEAPKTEAPKKEAPKTAEPVKQTQKPAAPKPAEPVKAPETVKPPTATQKPPAPSKPNVSTAEKIGTGVAIATTAALTGKEALAANIAKYESKGSSGKSFGGNEYNAYNKGTSGNKIIGADKPIDFSSMTIQDYFKRTAKTKQFPQGNPNLKPGDPETLFAIGRYQIIPPTMLNLVEKLKLDPKTTYLDPSTQDLLFSKGLTTSVGGRAAIDNYIKGKPGVTRDDAIMALAKEFASVGVPYDTKRGDVIIKKGQSYYSGLGGNKAHNSPEEVGAALDIDRAKNLKLSPTPQNVGNQIDQSSKQNKDMKVQDKPAPVNVQQNTTNVSNTSESSTPPKVDDRPAHKRK